MSNNKADVNNLGRNIVLYNLDENNINDLETEKRANEIMGKLLMKKAIIPIVAMIILIIVGAMMHINGWIILAINLGICVATFFYIRKQAQEFQNFTPYVGNLISLEQKGKKEYVAILKQGKKPIKLKITHGAEDLQNIKKNQLVQISYNSKYQIAILVTR